MLERAVVNCRAKGVATGGLVVDPINWTDTEGYARYFLDKGIRFDVVLLNSNSLCHLPARDGFLDKALVNFRGLLVQSGLLVVDTKRYGETLSVDGIRMYRELSYGAVGWTERDERVDGPRDLTDRGESVFRTRMRYDVHPIHKVCRATVEVTIESEGIPDEKRELSYFPLPVEELERWMNRVGGYQITRYSARSEVLDWGYDTVVARKIR